MKINHTMCISRTFSRFVCYKTKKNFFFKYCLQCFSCEKILIKYKENCLIINGKQIVKQKGGSFKFKKSFRTISCAI